MSPIPQPFCRIIFFNFYLSILDFEIFLRLLFLDLMQFNFYETLLLAICKVLFCF